MPRAPELEESTSDAEWDAAVESTRCDELKLCVPRDEDRAKVETAAYLSALVSNYLFTGRLKRGP